jgi:hypothetical protein
MPKAMNFRSGHLKLKIKSENMAISEETRKLVFNKLKMSLEKVVPPLVVKIDVINDAYELIGNKPVPYGYDKKMIPGMYFATIAQRKDSVVFYFFPSYMNPGLKEVAPSLYKCLKGKTCFHFKKEEQVNEDELMMLIEQGIIAWKKFGYMK